MFLTEPVGMKRAAMFCELLEWSDSSESRKFWCIKVNYGGISSFVQQSV